MQLKYEIVESTLPFTDYYSVMKVKPGANPGETTVTWMGRFYRHNVTNFVRLEQKSGGHSPLFCSRNPRNSGTSLPLFIFWHGPCCIAVRVIAWRWRYGSITFKGFRL